MTITGNEMAKLFDAVGRDLNAFYKAQAYNEDFEEALNERVRQEVEKFFETMPKLSHTVKVKNPKTKVESDVVLEGLASFFG